MERRARRIAGLRRGVVAHLEGPRQRGGAAEQLLVEPVAPPADGLGQRDTGRDAGDRHGYVEPAPLGCVQPHGDAQGEAAGNAEAALPDGEDAQRVVGERVPRGGHVVEPRPDHPAEHTPHAHCCRIVACARTAGLEAAAEQPDPCHDAQGDDHAVGMDREWADIDRAVGRAGDGCREVAHHHVRGQMPPRRRANSTVRSKMMCLS